MNLKQFRKKGGESRWNNFTEEQRKAHIKKMTDNSLATRRKIRDEK